MKIFFTYTLTAIFFLSVQFVSAQDVETSSTNPELLENETVRDYQAEESMENMSVEELKALETESKAREKEALKEAKEAKKLEKQIQKTKNAEARAIKARKTADQQAEKTKNAIENYKND
jgi:hypothetical protein